MVCTELLSFFVQLFQKFGKILRVYLAEPPKGYAFVTYANEHGMKY